MKENHPYRPYYSLATPIEELVNFKRVSPKTSENCIGYGLCAQVYPMGSINPRDVSWLNGSVLSAEPARRNGRWEPNIKK